VGNARAIRSLLDAQKRSYTLDTLAEKVFLDIHFKDHKVYATIPDTELHKVMLFVRHTNGYKVDYKQVVWSRLDDYILLEETRIESLSGVYIPIENNPSSSKNTLAAFPIIKTESTETSHHIDITDLFMTDVIDWNSGHRASVNKNLSFIKTVQKLPNEIGIQVQWGVQKEHGNVTQRMDFSFFALPEPMSPRSYDYRMGFFSEDNAEGISNRNYNSIASISRWHLEKKFKQQKISIPLKPITFWLSQEIPEQWRPYIKAGILEWLPAFEAAGFKNAIEVKELDDEQAKEMRNSVHYSIVRWGNYREVRGFEDSRGSTVSTVVDLRSGEILKADIIISSSLQYLSDMYFIRCAPLDKRTLNYPFAEDLMGELIQSVVAHETGHAFGMMDGNYGEYGYPFAKIRDAQWLQNMGHTPSIMNYTRHNYVVQPEDGIDPSLLIQKVGPSDLYHIRWAYTPFQKNEGENEYDFLETIIREQDEIPWYRYNSKKNEIIGPGATDEVVESDDPIQSTKLGLKNMKRVLDLLPVINKNRKDHIVMKRLYDKTLELWYNEMRHVLSLIGGYSIRYGAKEQFTPIPLEVQEEALEFVLLHAFNPPDWLTHPEWKSGISYSTYPDQVTELQLKLLLDLLSPKRMKRVAYMEKGIGYEGISKVFASKIQERLFKELDQHTISVTPNRQELQKGYIDYLSFGIGNTTGTNIGDTKFSMYTQNCKSLFTAKLLELGEEIAKIKPEKIGDEITYGHLERIKIQITTLE
tara:strand:- start:17473 stop:19731 length:2259 start_codon:yes stop_codon:yes gene_type:complete